MKMQAHLHGGASSNRHWFARLAIASWAGHIALFAFLVPASITGAALDRTGSLGYLTMAAIGVFSLAALADGAINDLAPARFTSCLMHYRHIGFMGLAILLVVMGGALALKSRQPMLLPSFLLPALFCVVVTWLDLYDRSRR